MTEETHSQSQEDLAIKSFFLRKKKWGGNRHGFLLDIGAGDGEYLSNTKLMLDVGWKGTLVEPVGWAFEKLLARYCEVPGVKLVQAAITTKAGEQRLAHMFERGVFSTTYDDLAAAAPGYWRHFFVPQVTPQELLGACPGPYHFINIDTEGSSVDTFEALDLHALQTEMVCVEYVYNRFQPDAQARTIAHATRFGLTETYFDNGNNLILGIK